MGMLIVGLIRAFIDFSAPIALLRKHEITRDDIDSAWTLRLIQGCLGGTIIALFAPLAVTYFKEPRLLEVLWALAACVVVAGAYNIGQTLALKEFNFRLDFTINAAGKLASVIATIGFGLILRDYRALTLGIVTGYLIPLLLSYYLHPYRPRWNTKKIGEIWNLTKWLLISNIAGFLLRQSDELIAARIGSTAEFGLYNVGSDLGQLPVAEIGPAMQRAILPVLASIQGDLERTRRGVLKTLSAVNTVIWPIGLGFAALSLEATELILGNKWIEASAFVTLFAITATIQSSGDPLRSFLTLLSHTKIQSTITWLEFFSFAVIAIFLIPTHHLIGLAYARLISSVLSTIYLAIASKQYCRLKYSEIIHNSYRPILTSVTMFFLVSEITSAFEAYQLKLLVGTLTGIIFYISVTLFTWSLSGRPEGFESTVYDKIIKFRKNHQ